MTFGKKATFSGARAMLAMGMTLGISAGSMGCDTVALISFQERAFSRVEGFGMTPLAGSCDGSTGTADLRFVMIADDFTPIRPNDVVSNQLVEVTRDSLGLTASRLYELPDISCNEDSCVFADDGFTCSLGLTGDDAQLRRCNRDLEMTISGNVSFAADVEKPQMFAFIVENAGSLDGWLPSDVGAYYVDWDGDGFAEGAPDQNLVSARASDRQKNRNVAFTQVANSWRDAARLALKENRRTVYGMWQFSGTSTADVRSLVNEVNEQLWTDQAATALSSVNLIQNAGQTRANVYQAMSTVMEGAMKDAEFANYEKTVVVFVDGPDDLRLNVFDEARVIQAAKDIDARLFIVHLDPAVATTGLDQNPLHRDDPRYWEDQEPCTSDASCENFEECRKPVGYSTTPNGAVEIGTTDTYCLPVRDDNGRVGPIHAYQRIACETDGSYIYVTSPLALRPRMQWLPHAMDGLWKAEATVDAFENRRVAPGEGYKVQTTMSVNVGQTQRNFTYSQTGDTAAGTQLADQDTRGVLFHK